MEDEIDLDSLDNYSFVGTPTKVTLLGKTWITLTQNGVPVQGVTFYGYTNGVFQFSKQSTVLFASGAFPAVAQGRTKDARVSIFNVDTQGHSFSLKCPYPWPANVPISETQKPKKQSSVPKTFKTIKVDAIDETSFETLTQWFRDAGAVFLAHPPPN